MRNRYVETEKKRGKSLIVVTKACKNSRIRIKYYSY